MPPVSMVAIFAMLGLRLALNPRMRFMHRSATETLGLLLVLAILASFGPLIQGTGLLGNLEALKFFAFFASFWLGYQVDASEQRLRDSVYAMTIPAFAFYLFATIADFNISDLRQVSPIYPPDNNHTGIIFGFLGFFLIAGSRRFERYRFVLVYAVFALLIQSRSLMAMIPFFHLFYTDRLRLSTVLIFPAMFLIITLMILYNINFDTFSDRLRLLIWAFSYEYAVNNSMSILAGGEANFGNALSQFTFHHDLVVSHAHNMFLQIWASYGLGSLVVVVLLFMHMFYVCWRFGDSVLAFQLATLLVFAQIEAVISDARILCVILLYVGMRMKMHHAQSVLPQPAQANR